MRSSFFELQVAMTGMFTARNGMQVTAHNMANVETPGFSRQVSLQRASLPISTFTTTGMVGTGSEAFGVSQIRNTHLDHRFWNERPILGRQNVIGNQLTVMETMFGELSDTGLSANFNTFFEGLQDLSTHASNPTNRNSFIQSINVLSSNIQNQARALLRQQQDINREIGNVVTSMNNIGEQIANLNNQIARFELIGGKANDLRDQRALLVDQLSIIANVTVTESNINGQDRFIVHIDGHEFVHQSDFSALAVVRRTDEQRRNPHDADGLYTIQFANGRPFDMYSPSLSGELRGLIDIRDGSSQLNLPDHMPTTDFRGIPYYIHRLNEMVRTFADAFNFGIDHRGDPIPGVTGHANALGPDGEPIGRLLFTSGSEGSPLAIRTDINIFNFQLNPEIANDQNLLITSTDSSLGESSNDLLLGFLEIGTYQSLFREGTLFDFLNSKTGEIAMDLQNANNFEESQSDVLVVLQNQRLEVKGVNMDEEVSNLIFFQHQFQVASRLISTINEVYDTMINRMGV